jgi:hypothetical protein
MAIQISGTEVISNSRGLNNIASVDATTAASISAAGVGGGGTIDFTASGAISAGDVVVLNSNGTVSVAGQTFTTPTDPPTLHTTSVYESASTDYQAAVYDPINEKVVLFYSDKDNSNYLTVVIATISGTSLTLGTPTVVNSAASQHIGACYDSTNSKIIASWGDAFVTGQAIVGTVSGTSISFGTKAQFESGFAKFTACVHDVNANKIVIVYEDDNNFDYGTAVVGTVSGSAISFGTPSVFYNSANTDNFSICYDSANNKVVAAWRASKGYAAVGTVSGTSISFGTAVAITTNNINQVALAFDENTSKVAVILNHSSFARGEGYVGTVSGTSISFGTSANFVTGGNPSAIRAAYNSNLNTVGFAYKDATNSNKGTFQIATISGTTMSFGSDLVFEAGAIETTGNSIVFDTASNKWLISYCDTSNANYGTASLVGDGSTASSTADDWIGISTEAISDTATGTVTVIGGVNEQQSGLTVGSTYYVSDSGTLSTSGTRKIGKALAATDLLITEGNT